jgi:hypothetical protein
MATKQQELATRYSRNVSAPTSDRSAVSEDKATGEPPLDRDFCDMFDSLTSPRTENRNRQKEDVVQVL